jgi:uncharacterized protein (DUF4213/DUF364 family)
MGIIHDLLDSINGDVRVKDIRQGPFRTAVWSKYCGLASTPSELLHCHEKSHVKEAGDLTQKTVRELAHLALSPGLFEVAIGMAAINSSIDIDNRCYKVVNAREILIERGKNKNVALIGHFPFVPLLRKAANNLSVIEINPQEGDLAESEAKNILPQADVIGITGSAFINDTIDGLLNLCNPKSFVLILGGSTPLSPILFDYGVDAVAGTIVTKPEVVLQHVSQGATFRQIKGIKLVTMFKEMVNSG